MIDFLIFATQLLGNVGLPLSRMHQEGQELWH